VVALVLPKTLCVGFGNWILDVDTAIGLNITILISISGFSNIFTLRYLKIEFLQSPVVIKKDDGVSVCQFVWTYLVK
jgi:hypothetical protein